MGLQSFLMNRLIENSAIGKKIRSGNDVSKKGQFALDATEKNPNIEDSMAEKIANLENETKKIDNSVKKIISLPNGASTGDAQIEEAKVGIEGETYDTLGDAIREQVKTYRDVDVSNNKPTGKARVWVNTASNDTESQDILLPQVDDNNVSEENTWSSKKVDSEIGEVREGLEPVYDVLQLKTGMGFLSNEPLAIGKSWVGLGIGPDARYITPVNLLHYDEPVTIINPNPNKYYISIGYFNELGAWLGTRTEDVCSLTISADEYFRIAFKFRDDRELTETDSNELINAMCFNESVIDQLDTDVKKLSDEVFGTVNLLSKEWLCGYSFSSDYPQYHEDNRYFVTKEKIRFKAGDKIINPNPNKYLYAIGFFGIDNKYIDSNYDNAKNYIFGSDCYARIAIKKTNDSSMTIDEMNSILDEFFNDSVIDKLRSNGLTDYVEHVVTVGVSGDYTSLTDALNNITDNSKNNRYVVKILEGTYNLPSTERHFGLKNYVRIVGVDKYKCIVKNEYSDTVYDDSRNTFDAGHYTENIEYASIENLTIICKGGKAPIHIDCSNHVGTIEVKNCILYDMNLLSMTNLPIRSNNYNAGGINVGMRGGRTVNVCDTISNGTIYAHNAAKQSEPCYFNVQNSQFVCTTWGDLGSTQADEASFTNCHFNDFYFGCSAGITSTKVKTILRNNDIKTITSYGTDWRDGDMFGGWKQVFGGKCEVIEDNIHVQVFNNSSTKINAGSLVQLVNIRGTNANGIHVKEYDNGLLFGYAMEDIDPNSFGLVQYRNDVEIPLIDGISVGDEIEYSNGTYKKKTSGKTVGFYLGSAPYFRYKMRLNVI